MGSINLTYREIEAIKKIDERELNKAIDQSIRGEQSKLAPFPLADCGVYVANKLHHFESDLSDYARARSEAKRDEALYRLRRSGETLWGAFLDIRHRMEQEEKHRELFYIDDDIYTPTYFSADLSVDVSYQWRKTPSDEWNYGHITFRHRYSPRPDYLTPAPKRKPSKAQQARARHETLFEIWDHLRRTALYSIRDYFEAGNDGSKIPESFQAVPDYDGGLNNCSTDFWPGKNIKTARRT